MPATSRPWLLGLAAIGLGALPALAAAASPVSLAQSLPKESRAQQFYAQVCANCHGLKGKGDGPVAAPEIWRTIEGADLDRKPRNFVDEPFRFGSSDEAIARSIRKGVPESAMSGYEGLLSEEEIQALTRIVQNFRHSKSPKRQGHR